MDEGDEGDERYSDRSDEFEVLVVGPFAGAGIHHYMDGQIGYLKDHVSVSAHDVGSPSGDEGWSRYARGLLLGLFALVRFPFRRRPDVVHVHTCHSFCFYRASLYVLFVSFVWGVPSVLHIHGSSFDDFVQGASRTRTAYFRFVFRASDRVIVLSEYWKDVASDLVDERKIWVIPNAVDPALYPANTASDTPVIVFVSALVERKGAADLAVAIERLCQGDDEDFEVVIAGSGPLSGRIAALDETYDEVTYLGYVPEEQKRSLLARGTIYVLPSYAEGLPIALLEGMAGGNAIVTTPVGSIPEVIDDARGILVEPGNVDELVRAIRTLMASPELQRRMAETNRRTVEERYSWDLVIDELLDLYGSLTRDRPRHRYLPGCHDVP